MITPCPSLHAPLSSQHSWHWPRHKTLMSISGLLPEWLLPPGRFSQIFPWLAPSCLSGLSSQIYLPQAPPLHSLWHLQGQASSSDLFTWLSSIGPQVWALGAWRTWTSCSLQDYMHLEYGTSDTVNMCSVNTWIYNKTKFRRTKQSNTWQDFHGP